MTRSILKTRSVLILAAALAAGSAQAATVSECVAYVGVAQASITAATTFAHAKDQVALLGKADSASLKLDSGKFADAALVLTDMSAKVTELVGAAKPKLDAAEGATISADIAAASACVAQLMSQ